MKGAFTALITPFKNDGEIDFEALAALVNRQIDGGINGLVPCGTTGEAATMSDDEICSVVSHVAEVAAGRVPIVAGTGFNDTKRTIAFTQRVSKLGGVDAALVVTPYYNKPSQRGLRAHFEAVATDGGLPVVLYNVPGRTAVSMTADAIGALASNPNIIAVKEATGDMVLATNILEQAPDFNLLSGDDFTTFPFLAVGGVGCISVVSNLDPKSVADMCAAVNSGDLETGRKIHLSIQPLARSLFSDTNPVPVKTAASILGWCGPTLRAPLIAPTGDVTDDVRRALASHGLLS